MTLTSTRCGCAVGPVGPWPQHSGRAEPALAFTHVERSAKAGVALTPFIHEVRAARFLHLDRCVL